MKNKDKQRIYIRGVKGRGSEVIKMLEDRGGRKNCYLDGANREYLYFINHKGFITFAFLDSEFGQIVMDNYTELQLPEKWKDGDILINNDGTDYKVFWEYDSDSDTSFYAHNVSMHVNGTITQYSGSIWHGEKILCFRKDYQLATLSEVERFHELLHKHCKDWDAEKKQLVSWKWKPSIGDDFWVINCNGSVVCLDWDDSASEKETFAFGNCFRTEEEAKAAVERVKKALKGE